ncbi:MAG: ABC transporter substrate-binding protein [Tissierellia bacterium]|nr:ABC transporter substrate-binding protein [Tissierellia bacterium]
MKKKVTKVLAGLLVLVLLLSGCSGNNGGNNSKNNEALNNENGVENQGEQQEEVKSYKVGIVQYMDHVSLEAARQGFEDEIKKSGLDVTFDYQNANGDAALTTQIPQKFVGDKVDLIYTIATPAAQGALNVTTDIPILFAAVTDPLGAELVDDLAQPSGNVTGVIDYMNPKTQIESFLKIYPDVKTFGVIYNTGEQNSRTQLEELEKVANEMGLEIKAMGISSVNDIPPTVTSLKGSMDAFFAMTDNTVASGASLVAKELRDAKIPSLSAEEGQVKSGLLLSEGVDYYEQGVQAAKMAIKILEGTAISEIPVEEPEKLVKVVNEETAEILGLDLTDPNFENAEKVK